MIRLNIIKKKIECLEKLSTPTKKELTIEQRGPLELWKWGETIVKILRGVSFDDL